MQRIIKAVGNLPFDFAMDKTPHGQPKAPLSVSALSNQIEAALAAGLPRSVQVVGEVANHSVRNGHHYWSLRDETARIDCVMWASDARSAQVHAQNGATMVATGTVVHWGPGGRTQLKVRRLAHAGEGARLAELKARIDEFRAKGLLEPDRKQPLPSCPRCIAVLTARTGAAVHDVRATGQRRFPACDLLVVDIPVQGQAAAPRIARAVEAVDAAAERLGIDAIILTRGGGSIEDLWAFNEAAPALAVAACRVPIVAAIGHESDTTLCELVADHRASTPTQAAMVLLPDRAEEVARLAQTRRAIQRALSGQLAMARAGVDRLDQGIQTAAGRRVHDLRFRLATLQARLDAAEPAAVLARRRGRLDTFGQRLQAAARQRVSQARTALAALQLSAAVGQAIGRTSAHLTTLERTLGAVDPSAVLARGFTLTTTATGGLVRSVNDAAAGDMLHTRTVDGVLQVRVEDTSDEVPSGHGQDKR